MEFCGVTTPFRGVRVYKRSGMGMQGSETALEEPMSITIHIRTEMERRDY